MVRRHRRGLSVPDFHNHRQTAPTAGLRPTQIAHMRHAGSTNVAWCLLVAVLERRLVKHSHQIHAVSGNTE